MCKHEDFIDAGKYYVCVDCGKHLDKEKKSDGVWKVVDEVKKIVRNSGP